MNNTTKRYFAAAAAALTMLAGLLATPLMVQAQDSVTINTMTVRIWPEFDRASALVFLVGQTAQDAPTELRFTLPDNADLLVVAYFNRETNQPNDEVEYTTEGSEVVLNSPNGTFWVEYYDPALLKSGSQRSFDFSLPLAYAVNTLTWELQVPYGGTDMEVEPAGDGSFETGQYNLPIFVKTESSIPAEGLLDVSFTYVKESDTLSWTVIQEQLAAQEEQANSIPPDPAPAQDTPSTVVIILLIAGGLALVGGGVYFFLYQSGELPGRSKKGRSRTGRRRFCTKCGEQIEPGDRFCRHCGTKLHR